MLNPPLRSLYDPRASEEGSIDPLGLSIGYERLADRMLPGLTVRMARPRFLTLIAVCAELSHSVNEAMIREDPPPIAAEIAFEWWIVEAFARLRDNLLAQGGIPGIQKVRRAVDDKLPVSASRYLKTPSVFGFGGVYRRLAISTGILNDDMTLGDSGRTLIDLWAHGCSLKGFREGLGGAGADFRRDLEASLRKSVKNGETFKQPAPFWESLVRYFDPMGMKKEERAKLSDLILNHAPLQDSINEVRWLQQALVARGSSLTYSEEAPFMKKFRATAPSTIQRWFDTVDAYERVCMAMVRAFDVILYRTSLQPVQGLTAHAFSARKKTAEMADDLRRAIDALAEFEPEQQYWRELVPCLQALRECATPDALFEGILNHHQTIQHAKPPNGKRIWFERGLDGRVLIRPDYIVLDEPHYPSKYIHNYRLTTLSRFLKDLKELRG